MSNDYVIIEGRRYPSQYPPGSGSAELDAAWSVLDMLKPDAISDEIRCFLAGAFCAELMKARRPK